MSLLALALAPALPSSAASAVGAAPAGPTRLHLVTLAGPGTAGSADGGSGQAGPSMRVQQDAVLAEVGAPTPVYRWTTALNGLAVDLDPDQAERLAGDPRVSLVEPSTVRAVAGLRRGAAQTGLAAAAAPPTSSGPDRGGSGTVVGVVDTGIDPTSPAFSTLPTLGPRPTGFSGTCADPAPSGDGAWSAAECGGKIAAARWYVDGFGRGALRSDSSLSPTDNVGHGTQMASIAAGNAGVPARIEGRRDATTGGQAPDARLAVYKACWSAPDPAGDGCAAADLVAAIDQAVADGVDVLSLSVAGGTGAAAGTGRVDTVDRALLGAAEADVAVVAAAGNDPRTAYAAHPLPWVTTVGGAAGPQPTGVVTVADGGPSLTGASATARQVGAAPLVTGADVAADGAAPARARACAPGTLDPGATAGTVVLCERGLVGRVDKSATVALADGVGMVLVNTGKRATYADLHEVPTVHLSAARGAELVRWLRSHPRTVVSLAPDGDGREVGLTSFSAPGDARGAVLKPDVVAPATGLLSATTSDREGPAWDVAAGTSAATAWTAGSLATLRSRRPGWNAVEARSALATRGTAVPGVQGLRAGAGRAASPQQAVSARLSYPQDPAGYRAWLDGDGDLPNLPSVLLSDGATSASRTVRNTSDRALYFSSGTRGFRTDVEVLPRAVRLGPGERVTFTIRSQAVDRVDDGYVVWRGGDGSRSRIPVVLAR